MANEEESCLHCKNTLYEALRAEARAAVSAVIFTLFSDSFQIAPSTHAFNQTILSDACMFWDHS